MSKRKRERKREEKNWRERPRRRKGRIHGECALEVGPAPASEDLDESLLVSSNLPFSSTTTAISERNENNMERERKEARGGGGRKRCRAHLYSFSASVRHMFSSTGSVSDPRGASNAMRKRSLSPELSLRMAASRVL